MEHKNPQFTKVGYDIGDFCSQVTPEIYVEIWHCTYLILGARTVKLVL